MDVASTIAKFDRAEWALGLVCAALVVGEALGLAVGGWAAAWPLVGLIAVGIFISGYALSWHFWPIGFCIALGLALAMRAVDERRTALREIELRNGPYEDVFYVRDAPRLGATDADGFRWVSFHTAYAGGRLSVVMLRSVTNDVPCVGERWACAGWLSRAKEREGRGACLWVRGRGTHAECLSPADMRSFDMLLARVRRNLSRRIGIGLEDRPILADLHRAMLLGERAALPGELRETFSQAGTVHVFAISGLHVMIVAQILLYAILLTMFPIRWAGIVLTPVLWLYVLLIGAPPSAVRAAAMASVYYAAPILWRRPDGLAAWEVTLVVFALVDPIGLFGIGSLLSFSVMLAILLAVRWARPFASRLVDALCVPFAAWAAGVPIIAHVFGNIAVGGLLANLMTVPMAGAAVLTGALGVAMSLVSERLAAHVNNLAALFTEGMTGVSWAVSRLPGASVTIVPWTLPTCAAWYVAIILLFVWIRMVWTHRRRSLV